MVEMTPDGLAVDPQMIVDHHVPQSLDWAPVLNAPEEYSKIWKAKGKATDDWRGGAAHREKIRCEYHSCPTCGRHRPSA